jgi:hypothetical protein
MHDVKQSVEAKIARVRAAVSLESHDRVPVVGLADFWPVAYSKKHTMQDAFYSIEVAAECYKEAFTACSAWDAFNTALYSVGAMLDALGSKRYNIPGRDLSPHVDFQQPDLELMAAEEYAALIEDPIGFQVEQILPRMCSSLSATAPSVSAKALAKAALFFGQWVEKGRSYGALWRNEYGIPPLCQGTALYMPIDWLADKLRGFRQALIDIKERPEDVVAACEALSPFIYQVGLLTAPASGDYPLLFNPQHVSPFISPRDYDRVYWPTFKGITERFVEKGYRIWLFLEGNQEQHLERLQDLPNGKFVANLESTDLAKAKKALGGRICIAGGMPSVLLARGTPQEVEERTIAILKLFEDEPGFIMACNTIIPSNAKWENVRAWLNAVGKYGRLEERVKEKEEPPAGKGAAAVQAARNEAGTFQLRDGVNDPFTRWETVRADLGKIEGDEAIIERKWEDLDKLFLPFLYWLIK